MTISLTPELERFVAAKIASGRYHDPTEVVEEGLRLLEAQEQDHQAALSSVRAKIAEGLAAIRSGDVCDGDAFFDELERQDQP